MTEIIMGGAVTVIAAAIGAAVAWRQATLANQQATLARESADRAASASRQRELEDFINEQREALTISQKREHLHYLWNRELVDWIYQGKPPPPPPPPPGLLDL